MKKKYKVKGVWWLPENKDHRLNGILHYIEDERYKLELFGELKIDPKNTNTLSSMDVLPME